MPIEPAVPLLKRRRTRIVATLAFAVKTRRRPVTTGRERMIGRIGVAYEAFEGAGRVRLDGELWNAISARPVASGEPVRVLAVADLKLTVEPTGETP